GNPPQLFSPRARREPPGQLRAVDQPFGLGVGTDQRGGEQHSGILSYRHFIPAKQACDRRYRFRAEAAQIAVKTRSISAISAASARSTSTGFPLLRGRRNSGRFGVAELVVRGVVARQPAPELGVGVAAAFLFA